MASLLCKHRPTTLIASSWRAPSSRSCRHLASGRVQAVAAPLPCPGCPSSAQPHCKGQSRVLRHFSAPPTGTAPAPATALAPAPHKNDLPDLMPGFSSAQHAAATAEMTARVVEAEARLAEAELSAAEASARHLALLPYRAPPPRKGIIGNSKYARRLRREVLAAAKDPARAPVLVSGEHGAEKGQVAALVHFCSGGASADPLVQVDCEALDDCASLLLGSGSRRGLLHWLRAGGTLVVLNAHKASPELAARLAQIAQPHEEGCQTWWGAKDAAVLCRPRVIFTAEAQAPALEQRCTVIKVPPLRARPSDITATAAFLLRRLARARGLANLVLTPEAEKRLQSYAFPHNMRELESLLERAAAQAKGQRGEVVLLGERDLWFAQQDKDRHRADLLKVVPHLRQALLSDWWTRRLNTQVTPYAFAALLAALFLGPQDRAHNMGLNMVWAMWWPGMFLIYPSLGRVWCAICPFMAVGDLVRTQRETSGAQLAKWPKSVEAWGPWFLAGLFAAILVWEEVWDLQNTGHLTAWLLLLITVGAVAGSLLFERRFWCRYLCPIGGMNGLFAKLSMTEVRARQGVCTSNCTEYKCIRGGQTVLADGSIRIHPGCPAGVHPANHTDNRLCSFCMECVKACPNGSVELRVRVPGVDLWTTHAPSLAEASVMFMLLGSVFLHHLPQLAAQAGLDPGALLDDRSAHILASVAVLAAPGLLCTGADFLWHFAGIPALLRAPQQSTLASGGSVDLAEGAPVPAGPQPQPLPFLQRAYGYLPLVWASTLAHYLRLFLGEAGTILPATAATFGLEYKGWPALSVHPEIISFLQGCTLLLGWGLSLSLTRKIVAGRPFWQEHLPQLALFGLLTAELWALVVGH